MKMLSKTRPFAVHADGDVVVLQNVGKILARELRSLVGVEDLRDAKGKSLFEGLHAKGGVEGKRYLPGKHVPAVPVHDCREVDKALPHGDVGDVRTEDLVGPCDVQAFQEIGVNLMLLVGPGQLPLRSDALEPHPAHETGDAFAVDLAALSFEPVRHPGDAPRGVLGVLPVNELHETEVKVGDRDRRDSRSLTGKGSRARTAG